MKKHKKTIIVVSIFLIVALIVFIVITYIYSSREKDFKATIRQAEEVRIMSGNTGESVLIAKEDIEKLADKIDEIDFKPVLFPEQRTGCSYKISYKISDNDWSMWFCGGYTQIVHNSDWKYYQDNRDLVEYVATMYKELGGK